MIISNETHDGKFVLIQAEKRTRFSDDTCVLQPGEHSFVTEEMAVRCKNTRFVSVKWLADIKTMKGCVPLPPISSALLKRLHVAIVKSEDVAAEIQDAIREQFPDVDPPNSKSS